MLELKEVSISFKHSNGMFLDFYETISSPYVILKASLTLNESTILRERPNQLNVVMGRVVHLFQSANVIVEVLAL